MISISTSQPPSPSVAFPRPTTPLQEGAILRFLDAQSRSRLLAALSGDAVAPRVFGLATESDAKNWFHGLLHDSTPAWPSAMPTSRGAMSWADVLDEADSWAAMRQVSDVDGVEMPAGDSMVGLVRELKDIEMASMTSFPHFSL